MYGQNAIIINELFGKTTLMELFNVIGSMYATLLFLGIKNSTTVQSVVSIERTVFYRERAARISEPLSLSSCASALRKVCEDVSAVIYKSLNLEILSWIAEGLESDHFLLANEEDIVCAVNLIFGSINTKELQNNLLAILLSSSFEAIGEFADKDSSHCLRKNYATYTKVINDELAKHFSHTKSASTPLRYCSSSATSIVTTFLLSVAVVMCVTTCGVMKTIAKVHIDEFAAKAMLLPHGISDVGK
ncbi:hypothetical protein RchiOBHm_Chr1g0366171 [Rosa chinensis]|uniref:Uncharacterized protein n=1 Tax=Rosa chinensis TaxID=74649 RepID=A0A2P6SK63_ROSCH|nr:hypothetical protein RchiOBHm_Chr1g0366171 [Rosa chinensis]